MKVFAVLLSILLSLAAITNARATAQKPELLDYNGKRVYMFEEPLWSYQEAIEKLNTSKIMSTACWRGYIGEWKIKNNKLFLLRINTGGGAIPLNKLFNVKPEPWYIGLFNKCKDICGISSPVFASWYSGVIRVPQGKLLQYVHMGYESIYESDLLLFLSKGVLVGQITIDNKKTIETNLKSFNDAKEKFKLAIADDQKLRENIDRKISRMKEIIAFDAAASTLADGCGGKNTDNPTDSYDQVLGSYLKKYWNTPYKEELGGKKPEVTVLINISADGRIASYRILKSSNNRPMDDSVERLFSSLKRVPQPPDRVAREFKLIMEIGEED